MGQLPAHLPRPVDTHVIVEMGEDRNKIVGMRMVYRTYQLSFGPNAVSAVADVYSTLYSVLLSP